MANYTNLLLGKNFDLIRSHAYEFEQKANHSQTKLDVIQSIYSFINWMMLQFVHLDSLLVKREKNIQDDYDFEVTLDMYSSFKQSFHNDYKRRYMGIISQILSNKVEVKEMTKITDFINIIKKPYLEVLEYPKRQSLHSDNQWFEDDWFSTLVETLETTAQKLSWFAIKIGINQDREEEIYVAIKLPENTSEPVSDPFNKENYIYKTEPIKGKEPFSCVPAA